jgi:molybdate transport repressor ModE-like protein
MESQKRADLTVGSAAWMDKAMRRLKLRDLSVMRAVVAAGSLSAAARALSVSTPVVWKAVADLEAIVGVPLFDRTTRGVTLTPSGEALLRCSVSVFDDIHQGLSQLSQLRDPSSGELRISAPEIMMAGVLPPIVDRFTSDRPAVRLAFLTVDSSNYFEPLRERRAELLMGRLPLGTEQRDLQSERLFSEPFVAYCAADHPLARRRKLKLADLLGEQWVLPSYASPPGGLIARIFQAEGLVPPAPTIETFSTSFSAMTVSETRRVGLLPITVLRYHARRLSLKQLPVALPDVRIGVELVTVRDRSLSPLARAFIECARAVSGALEVPSVGP